MTDLPTRIEAGEATDAEVAIALGWRLAGILWTVNRGETHRIDPPPFTTCLTTLAKECERRGLLFMLDADKRNKWGAGIWRTDKGWLVYCPADYDKKAPTPALALCAALVRAAQESEHG